jgi:hypothetical protein
MVHKCTYIFILCFGHGDYSLLRQNSKKLFLRFKKTDGETQGQLTKKIPQPADYTEIN